MKTTITEGQNLVDIAIQLAGSLEGIIDLLQANELSIDDELVAGQVLVLDESKIVSREIVRYFSSNSLRINTGSLPASSTPDFNEDFNEDFLI